MDSFDKYFEQLDAKREGWKQIKIVSKQDIINFIKEHLKVSCHENNGKYKGSLHCKYTMDFTKKGKMVIQARGVRKSFYVNNGYDIFKIFAGFEIV